MRTVAFYQPLVPSIFFSSTSSTFWEGGEKVKKKRKEGQLPFNINDLRKHPALPQSHLIGRKGGWARTRTNFRDFISPRRNQDYPKTGSFAQDRAIDGEADQPKHVIIFAKHDNSSRAQTQFRTDNSTRLDKMDAVATRDRRITVPCRPCRLARQGVLYNCCAGNGRLAQPSRRSPMPTFSWRDCQRPVPFTMVRTRIALQARRSEQPLPVLTARWHRPAAITAPGTAKVLPWRAPKVRLW